jgi:hypothetical protein
LEAPPWVYGRGSVLACGLVYLRRHWWRSCGGLFVHWPSRWCGFYLLDVSLVVTWPKSLRLAD